MLVLIIHFQPLCREPTCIMNLGIYHCNTMLALDLRLRLMLILVSYLNNCLSIKINSYRHYFSSLSAR